MTLRARLSAVSCGKSFSDASAARLSFAPNSALTGTVLNSRKSASAATGITKRTAMRKRRTLPNSVCLPVLHHRRDMKGGDFCLAIVIGEDNDAAAFRIYGGVIGGRNDVFAPITRANGKR